MIASKYITSLIIVIGIVLMWTHFCRQMDSRLYQARMNLDNILLQGCCRRTCSENLQMGKTLKQLVFKFIILISYFVFLSGCFYKLLTHNRLKYKVINGHESRQFFQWHDRTVMSLDDYIRDRMNNNLGMHELMKYEWARYESFKLYPRTAPLSPLKLARAGFYYTGENQTVKCFCCGKKFDANDYETLNENHQRNSCNCSFVRGEDSSNIPIKHSDRSDNVNIGSRDNQDMTQCKHPNYAKKESRRQSFITWPHENTRQTQEMVDAGLFYTGTGDSVRCYHCGIGFKDWSADDNPLVEHARFSPNCRHVRQQRPALIRPIVFPDVELSTAHKQETRSSDPKSSDMRTRVAQVLLLMGYTEDRICDAFNYFRRSGRQEILINDLLDYIKTTEPNLYNRDSPSYTMLCTQMNAANNSVDQNGSRIESGQQNGRPSTSTDSFQDLPRCTVCMENIVSIVFLPCGHLVCCADCAPVFTRCVVCRADIEGKFRVYLP